MSFAATERLFLAQHVFICALNDQVFLLDIRSDEYLCFRNSDALAKNVSGWPWQPSATTDGDTYTDDIEIISTLVARGMLTTEGKRAAAVDLRVATCDWSDAWRETTRQMTIPYVVPFVLSVLETLLLGLLPFKYRLEVARRRNRKRVGARKDEIASAIRKLTGVFLRLRAWAYTAQERCLFDALTMSAFFYRCGYSPSLVIGIQARPFLAHCWMQYEDCALNELDTHARRYAPILVA